MEGGKRVLVSLSYSYTEKRVPIALIPYSLEIVVNMQERLDFNKEHGRILPFSNDVYDGEINRTSG